MGHMFNGEAATLSGSAFGEGDSRGGGERRGPWLGASLDLRLELVPLLADVVVLELDGKCQLDEGVGAGRQEG